ncbi:unnamed protein product [Sphagnum troendelagicum]|jgi:uroporphyrinogen-III synthase
MLQACFLFHFTPREQLHLRMQSFCGVAQYKYRRRLLRLRACHEPDRPGSSLEGRVVAFTTPQQYAGRFAAALRKEGGSPLWCPTIITETGADTRWELESKLFGKGDRSEDLCCSQGLDSYGGIAFTSRAGIYAFAEAIAGQSSILREDGEPFLVAALGRDAELLEELDLLRANSRVRYIVPSVASPQALVDELGEGKGRRLLCPVPLVIDLEEPPVVPNFLRGLEKAGWVPVRLNAYITRWAGKECAQPLLQRAQRQSTCEKNSTKLQERSDGARDGVDALVFTSTAEVEGLIKSLDALVGSGIEYLKRSRREFVVAVHGPVTAEGGARLGIEVDIVGEKFQSFGGVVDSLARHFAVRT